MTKILVPVDFSRTSENALSYACKLFTSSPVEVTVLHIFGTQSSTLMMKSIDGILIKDAKEKLASLIKKMEKEAPHVTFNSKLIKNYATETIVALGDSDEFDLIVMGTKGASGLKEVFMGSIAGGVISKTKAPVLVIPSEYESNSINEMVIALNDEKLLEKVNLDVLKSILTSNNSKLTAFHVSKKDEKDSRKIINLNDIEVEIKNISGTGNTNEIINEFLKDTDADLLCLIKSKKDFITRMFSDSVTLKQTFNSSIPLLILHE